MKYENDIISNIIINPKGRIKLKPLGLKPILLV